MHPIESTDARSLVSFRWLIRVRWGAAALQVAVAAIAQWTLGLEVPVPPLFVIVGFSALTNLVVSRVSAAPRGAPTTAVAGTLIAIDTLLLTVSLALTGGPLNPFSVFYFVYITLAAVVLGARWTWFLTALAACGYGSLFLHAMQTANTQSMHEASMHVAALGLSSHLQGMWWAFVLSASLMAYFVVKLSSAIERRDRELTRIREQALRSERLASLTTLAAGAAHELSTPLATIAVVTGEIEHALERARAMNAVSGTTASEPPDRADDRDGLERPERREKSDYQTESERLLAADGLLADARLIRAELQRCRGILDRMAAQAGETVGEMPAPVSISMLVAEALRALPPDEAARVRVEAPDAVAMLTVPGRGVVTALVSLLRNAIDASTPPQGVTLAATAAHDVVRLIVRDRGAGMPPDVLARAGEPFFSTKPAGSGMGLGLFLTRALAERLGGTLHLESTPGEGTAATLELPASREATA